MNNNAYVHSEHNNNDDNVVRESSEADDSPSTDHQPAAEDSPPSATEHRSSHHPIHFRKFMSNSKVLGGRLVDHLRNKSEAKPEDHDEPEEQNDQKNVAPNTDKVKYVIRKLSKSRANYDVQDGTEQQENAVENNSSTRKIFNYFSNITNTSRSTDIRNVPSSNFTDNNTQNEEDEGNNSEVKEEKDTRKVARFPNVNHLLQRYANKRSTVVSASTTDDDNDNANNQSSEPVTEAVAEKNSKFRGLQLFQLPRKTPDDCDTTSMIGAFGWYPDFMQKFGTPQYFLLAFCLQNILQGAAVALILGSTTSIEKHFHFSSKMFGSILTFGEIGPIFTSLALSYFGSHGNRPRWMATGQCISMVGMLLAFANYFFYPPAEISELANPEGSQKMCRYRDLITDVVIPLSGLGKAASLRSVAEERCFPTNGAVYFSWLLVYTFICVGTSLVYSVGAPYLDDSISKKDSPMYFAISICVKILGPLIGFSATAALMKVYVNPLSNPGLTPSDPRWIGAWWISCLVCGILFGLVAAFTAIFPRKLKKVADIEEPAVNSANSVHPPLAIEENHPATILAQEEQANSHTNDDISANVENKEENLSQETNDDKTSIRIRFEKFRSTLVRLLKNKVVVYSGIADFFSLSGAFAVFVFLPKYLEHQFRVDKSSAVFFTGLAASSSVVIGVFAGGVFISRCRPSARTVTLITIACKIIYIPTLLALMNIGCHFTNDLPGVVSMDGQSLDLYRGCSGGCECSQLEFIPVCVTDGSLQVTFFSPCHAGCYKPAEDTASSSNIFANTIIPLDVNGAELLSPLQQEETHVYYKNCSCGSPTAVVRSGYCKTTCSAFTLFNVVHITVTSFLGLGTIGSVLIGLRCVSEADKASEIGLKSGISSLAMLLNPVLIGALTDTACMVWEAACGDTGMCWVYNVDDMGTKLFVTAMIMFSISIILDYMVYRNVKNVKLFDDEPSEPKERSIATLTKIFRKRTTKVSNNLEAPTTTDSINESVPKQYSLLNTFRKFSKSSLTMDKIWSNTGTPSQTSDKLSKILDKSTPSLQENNRELTEEQGNTTNLHDINLDDMNEEAQQLSRETVNMANDMSSKQTIESVDYTVSEEGDSQSELNGINKVNISSSNSQGKNLKNYSALRDRLSKRVNR